MKYLDAELRELNPGDDFYLARWGVLIKGRIVRFTQHTLVYKGLSWFDPHPSISLKEYNYRFSNKKGLKKENCINAFGHISLGGVLKA